MVFGFKRKVVIVGDSHVEAIKAALQQVQLSSPKLRVSAYILEKQKVDGGLRGDIPERGALRQAAKLRRNDVVVTAVQGNFHNVAGLVQHPQPFDFFLPDETPEPLPGRDLIPYQLMAHFCRERLMPVDVFLGQLTAVTKARVYVLMAPPPKEDVEFLKRYPSVFKARGIQDAGVSPAPLRLRLWRLQRQVTEDLCIKHKVSFLPIPDGSHSASGFLKPEYYADDATHANAAYGELILRQIMAEISPGSADGIKERAIA